MVAKMVLLEAMFSGATTLSTTSFRITTFCFNDIGVASLNNSYRYAECRYAECHFLSCKGWLFLTLLCWVSLCWVWLCWVWLCWVPLCWVPLRWVPLCWVQLCWVWLCWVPLCWVPLCWVPLCWVSWRHVQRFCFNHHSKGSSSNAKSSKIYLQSYISTSNIYLCVCVCVSCVIMQSLFYNECHNFFHSNAECHEAECRFAVYCYVKYLHA
jgi:hypothetical protein